MNIKVQKRTAGKKIEAPARSGFDLAYLRSISDNNHEFLREMIDTFVQSMPPVLKEMQQSLQDQDWRKLSRLAHQIKPSFRLLGIEALRKTVFYIEQNADQKTDLQ